MHFYTSVNNNYLPKARILAATVKKNCPNAYFTLVLADDLPPEVDVAQEYFDEILLVEDLGIPVKNLNLWIYQHTVVELCTAIKGQALVKFLEGGSEKVVYLDPDIAVFDSLEDLDQLLDQYDVVLTPHQTIPESNTRDIINNEICSLKHGIYNFGFFAVKNSLNGLKFARWWRDRLVEFCYDDIPNGIFTDQRWGDFVPAMFEGVYIWKDPGCNVSTWNLTHRQITKQNDLYYVNGSKLKFYHFSGFDSGAQKIMLDLYGKDNPYLYELRQWYIEQQEIEGQQIYGIGTRMSKYNYYDNGELVPKEARTLMRTRQDLLVYFAETNPYQVEQEKSYYYWYQNEMQREESIPRVTIKQEEYLTLKKDIQKFSKQLKSLSEQYASLKEQYTSLDGRHAERLAYEKELTAELKRIKSSKIWRIRERIAKVFGR